MPQSLAKVCLHLTFSTKGRTRCLTPEIRPHLEAYMAGTLRQLDSPAIIIGAVEDHVHVLHLLSRNYAIAKIVEEVKKGSSKWIKTQGEEFGRFHWQAGYGAFSISESHIGDVKAYIANQEAHHRKTSFQDEFRRWLGDYGIEFDERYVWD